MIILVQKTFAGAALAVTMLLGSALVAPAEASHGNSYSTTTQARASNELNLRYGPSYEYQVIRVIPYDRRVDILRCLPARDWCEVRYRGNTGWVSSQYLYNTGYNRSYNSWNRSDWVVAFDFFAHIVDRDRDRRRRYDRHRHNNDYYDQVRRNGRRGHDDWGRRHHGRDRANGYGRGRNDGRGRNSNRGHNNGQGDRRGQGQYASQASHNDNGDRGHNRGDRGGRGDHDGRGDRGDRRDRDDRDGRRGR